MGGESAGVARANDGRSRSEALLREGAASGRRGRPELCAGRYHFSARRSGGGTTLSDGGAPGLGGLPASGRTLTTGDWAKNQAVGL